MELTTIIIGILIAFGIYFGIDLIKEIKTYIQSKKKKDKLQDWKPHDR